MSVITEKKLGKFKSVSLAVSFLLTFSTFQYFPKLELTREIWVVVVAVLLPIIALLLHSRLKIGRSYIWYIFFLATAMPVYSAFCAYLEFGQPLFYGVLTQRSLVLVGSCLIITYLAVTKKISLNNILYVLIFLGWFTLTLYVSMFLFLDPARFGNTAGFVAGGNWIGYHFIFARTFIVFSFLYYVIRGLEKNNFLDFAKALCFLSYLFFIDGGRSMLLFLAITSMFVVIQRLSITKLVIFLPVSISIAIATLGAVYYYQSEYIDTWLKRTSDAITVVTTGKKSGDASADARIDEVELAIPYVEKNIVFGNGDLSHRWQYGYLSKMGSFAPSDIGLIGNVFVFGFVGIFIFLFQIVYWYKYSSLVAKSDSSLLFSVANAFLLYFFMRSIFTGSFIHNSPISTMFIAFLLIEADQCRRLKH